MQVKTFAAGVLVGAGLLLVALQFARPARIEPPHSPLLAGATVPEDVGKVFARACQDCHSNNTRWPWYAKVAPFSMLVAEDVNNGRTFLNLSEWDRYSKPRQLGYLSSMSEATRNQKMPPRLYSTMHSDARLSAGERNLISAWAKQERERIRAQVYSQQQKK